MASPRSTGENSGRPVAGKLLELVSGNQTWEIHGMEIHGSPAMELFNSEHHLYMLLVEPFAKMAQKEKRTSLQ